MPAEPQAEPAAEVAYRWTVRGLYLTLIAANIYVLWDSYKDTPEALVMRARLRRRYDALKNCEECAGRREALRKAFNRVLFQAEQIVEEAAAADTGEEPL
jgi:hypothetical protein